MELTDIGVNLTHRSFALDRDAVIDRARRAGVTKMIVTGTSVSESRAARTLALSRPGILCSTAGVHPHNARQCSQATIAALRDLSAGEQVVAIGECGLDFNRNFSPPNEQERWFEAQVELACDTGLPLFLHERDAHDRFLRILHPYRDRLKGAVVHCFTGTEREMKAYLDAGFHLGITGWICDERRGLHLRELVRQIPLDRVMLETDAPFLTPRGIAPKPKNGRNEPALLCHVLDAFAKATGMAQAEIAAATTRTADAFFGLTAGDGAEA